MIEYVLILLMWTFVLYSMHVLSHRVEFLYAFHKKHHENVDNQLHSTSFKFTHIFLYIDDYKSSIDQ